MLILASKSPRRKEILDMINIDFEVLVIDVEENIELKNPTDYVLATAKKKGEYAKKLKPNDTILSCDTIVVLDDKILEKPKSKEQAYEMIKELSGKIHLVYTGVYICDLNENVCENFYVVTKVIVDEMSEKEIIDYINTDEPYDKAGGYAIQGLFAKYIKGIEGDYFNVMGLPINEVYFHLKKFLNI